MQIIKATQFDPRDTPEADYPRCMQARRGNHVVNFGHWGHLGFYGGKPGTMKSTAVRFLVAAGLSGEEKLMQTFDLGDRLIIYADGEMPEDLFHTSMHHILKIAGKPYDDRLLGMSYTGMTNPTERYRDLLTLINKHRKEIGLVVWDGVANFMADPMDRHEAIDLLNGCGKLGRHFGMINVFINHLIDKNDKSTKLYGTIGSEVEKLASWGFTTVQQGKYFGQTKGKFRYKAFPNLWYTREDDLLIPEPYFPI